MSPRIKKIRKVMDVPIIKGFKPYGLKEDAPRGEPVMLLLEEYEALRLCDYDMYNHHQSSVMMNVSRPTFTRIYASARQKVVKAFVEGRQITIEGGKVYFDSTWYHCVACGCYFNNPDKEIDVRICSLCGSSKIKEFDHNLLNNRVECFNEKYYCPDCGFESNSKSSFCPSCKNTMMIKKRCTHYNNAI